MSDNLEPNSNPRRIWPWFLLAAVVAAAVLAYLWVSAEVRRVKKSQRFDFRVPPITNAPPAAPAIQTNAIPPPPGNSGPESPSSAAVQERLPASNPGLIAGFLPALNGGDAAAGRNIFFNKPEASCGKCHRVGKEGGDNGPALDDIGARATREFILESMVAPNATITKGFETVIVRLKNGSGQSGVLRHETATNLVIHTPDDGPITVNKSDLAERLAGISPMPADFPTLISTKELQNLVAFLVSLTNVPPVR